MAALYNLNDVKKGYLWLGHEQYTELNAFHKDFKQGNENFKWNKEHGTFTKVDFARNYADVERFVKKYFKDHQLVMGENPRPQKFTNERGFPRSAKESEIEFSTNMLFDIDVVEKKHVQEKLADLEMNLIQFKEYFNDLGLLSPITACTGQGYHLLFPFPAIRVSEYKDIAHRIKAFQQQFRNEFSKTLNENGVRLDSTYDLVRKIRIYGTAKPKVGYIADFFGEKRIEDPNAREYLLNIDLPKAESAPLDEIVKRELPLPFVSLMERDARLRGYWLGTGKSDNQSTSASRCDFSLVRYCLQLGIDSVSDLTTILKLRPDGVAGGSGGGKNYVQNTIGNAIKSL